MFENPALGLNYRLLREEQELTTSLTISRHIVSIGTCDRPHSLRLSVKAVLEHAHLHQRNDISIVIVDDSKESRSKEKNRTVLKELAVDNPMIDIHLFDETFVQDVGNKARASNLYLQEYLPEHSSNGKARNLGILAVAYAVGGLYRKGKEFAVHLLDDDCLLQRTPEASERIVVGTSGPWKLKIVGKDYFSSAEEDIKRHGIGYSYIVGYPDIETSHHSFLLGKSVLARTLAAMELLDKAVEHSYPARYLQDIYAQIKMIYLMIKRGEKGQTTHDFSILHNETSDLGVAMAYGASLLYTLHRAIPFPDTNMDEDLLRILDLAMLGAPGVEKNVDVANRDRLVYHLAGKRSPIPLWGAPAISIDLTKTWLSELQKSILQFPRKVEEEDILMHMSLVLEKIQNALPNAEALVEGVKREQRVNAVHAEARTAGSIERGIRWGLNKPEEVLPQSYRMWLEFVQKVENRELKLEGYNWIRPD